MTMIHTTLPEGHGTIALARDTKPESATLNLLAGQAYLLNGSTELSNDGHIDLTDIGRKLKALADQVDAQFVGLREPIEMTILAAAAGKTGFFLSPPGYGKTAFQKSLAQGFSGNFFPLQLHPEMNLEDIFGPYAHDVLQAGGWERDLDGFLVTADFAFLDEIWKMTPEGLTPLLALIQERIYMNGKTLIKSPLHFLMSASNEIPTQKEQLASWDRWLLRAKMPHVTDGDDFMALFDATAGRQDIDPVTTVNSLRLMAAAAEVLAFNTPLETKEAARDLWADLRGEGIEHGPRRWKETMIVAAANALLDGRYEIDSTDLAVGRYTLWSDPDDAENVAKIVMAATDSIYNDVLNVEADLASLKQRLAELDADDSTELVDLAEVAQKATLLEGAADDMLIKNGLGSYRQRVQAVSDQAQQLTRQAMTPRI